MGLSGGQQQRLCIARAIACDPEVILMDEPCSALDPIATGRIEDLMSEIKTQFSIVIVTHNMQQAARVSRPVRLLHHRGQRDQRHPHRSARRVRQDRADLLQPQRRADRELRDGAVRLTVRRQQFTEELEQLRLQVELMAVRVDQNLERMRDVLRTGDSSLAAAAIAADNEIDAMNLSLMERCYDMLRREAPVASDLRFIVSVLRVLSELERIGDLSLRVDKVADEHELLSRYPAIFEVLVTMADEALERYRTALRAWATMDLGLAVELASNEASMDVYQNRLTSELVRLEGPDAARVAMVASGVGRAIDRISDHATIIGVRLRYLITGDPEHLAAEIR